MSPSGNASVKLERGFTLLEVLVAVSILGIGLTAILSAQTGLFASSLYAERVSVAVGLARCKMSETEIKLTKMGYPLVDQTEEGVCCNDEATTGYTCKWKIEKIILPNPPSSTIPSGSSSAASSGAAPTGSAPSLDPLASGAAGLGAPPGLGPLSALASLGMSGGAALGGGAGLGDISKFLGNSSFAPGMSSLGNSMGAPGGMATPGAMSPMGGGSISSMIAPMFMSFVYPTLKPMLEASIRKVTVTVEWKEGSIARSVEAVQFVSNPQQGGIDPNAPQLDQLIPGLGGLLGGSGTGTGTGTGTGAGLGGLSIPGLTR